MSKYRLWCKSGNEWEKESYWIGMNGCVMTLRGGRPCPLN